VEPGVLAGVLRKKVVMSDVDLGAGVFAPPLPDMAGAGRGDNCQCEVVRRKIGPRGAGARRPSGPVEV
jgi:hypothetical protein